LGEFFFFARSGLEATCCLQTIRGGRIKRERGVIRAYHTLLTGWGGGFAGIKTVYRLHKKGGRGSVWGHRPAWLKTGGGRPSPFLYPRAGLVFGGLRAEGWPRRQDGPSVGFCGRLRKGGSLATRSVFLGRRGGGGIWPPRRVVSEIPRCCPVGAGKKRRRLFEGRESTGQDDY